MAAGGDKKDSRFREGNRHLRLTYEEEEEVNTLELELIKYVCKEDKHVWICLSVLAK